MAEGFSGTSLRAELEEASLKSVVRGGIYEVANPMLRELATTGCELAAALQEAHRLTSKVMRTLGPVLLAGPAVKLRRR